MKTRYQKSKPLRYGWAHEKEKWNSVVINDVAFKLSNHKVTCSSVSGTKEMKGLHPLPLQEGGFLYNIPITLLQLKVNDATRDLFWLKFKWLCHRHSNFVWIFANSKGSTDITFVVRLLPFLLSFILKRLSKGGSQVIFYRLFFFYWPKTCFPFLSSIMIQNSVFDMSIYMKSYKKGSGLRDSTEKIEFSFNKLKLIF